MFYRPAMHVPTLTGGVIQLYGGRMISSPTRQLCILHSLRHPERRAKSSVEPVGRCEASGSRIYAAEIPPSVLLRSSIPLRFTQNDTAALGINSAFCTLHSALYPPHALHHIFLHFIKRSPLNSRNLRLRYR